MLKKLFSYSAGLYIVSLFASVMHILVKSLIAKTMDKEALGAYAYYTTVIVLVSSVVAFGLKRSLAKHVAANREESSFAPVVSLLVGFGLVVSLLLSALGVALQGWIDWVYVLVLISVGPYTLFDLARSALRGQFDQRREIFLAALGVVVQTISVVLFVLVSRNARAPVWGLALSNIVLAVGVAIYFIQRYRRYWHRNQLWQIAHSSGFNSLLLLSTPLWITDILDIVGHQSDQLILQGKLGFSAMAEYAAAFTFIGILDQPITVMSRIFLVTFAGGHYADIDQYKRLTSLNLAFFSVLGFLVVAIAPPLTPILFTNTYTLVPLLVVILSTSCIFSSIEVLNSSLTIANDYPQANRNSKLWITAAYIPLTFYLVSHYGAVGAAWSNVASWGGYSLVHAIYMRRRLPQHAAFTFRELGIGSPLYLLGIWSAWMLKSPLATLSILVFYLGVGHLLRLWNLADLPLLIRRLMPDRLGSLLLFRAAPAPEPKKE